jgi:hypothetical protein
MCELRYPIVALLLLALASCAQSRSKEQRAAPAGSAARPPAALAPNRHALELSAYTATLAAADEVIFVLASRAAYRFEPSGAVERWEIELGDTPALGDRGIVHWSNGALRLAPKRPGPVEVLATVPQPPRRLSAFGEHLVWEEAAGSASLLRTLDGGEPRTIYRSEQALDALALMDDQAYFVESASGQWRIGRVALSGGAVRYSERHTTRTPSRLTAAGDVFFYDGPSSTVRRVSSDLSREDVLVRDVICSPLAVADRPGTITALVATPSRVAWLLDAGQRGTELEILSR